ncbi:V-set and transmembrane domain-containing protein 4a isoform X2 [Nerophis lumbriciformis]|uniref:V-set and transmembrane domain-containing protein 4a isoform X2 n=1 Tax=Nerophis lumbriciformis TaxID=546530 RepID=UPI002ADFCCC4|nr:V-set and transmembrane domain-containing protein 4-like isoform X2 [Nerophis lumbriciformis]
MYISVVLLVLIKALLTVCHALNVTVIPGPVVTATERANLTLSCLVSQRKRSSSVLVLRWFVSPLAAPSLAPPLPSPSTSTAAPEPSQFLIVKMSMKKIKLYGNYTRRFPQPKFRLYEQTEGEVYRLKILNVSGTDQGFYTCRVHEIRKTRNVWRASSNGSATTQLTVHFTLEARSSEGIWHLLSDVNVCAVVICSLGLLSIFLFTLTLTIQYFYRRQRLKASYLLVRCPESSSGETVTSSGSSSSSSPKTQKKDTGQKSVIKVALKPPKVPEKPLPQTPVKGSSTQGGQSNLCGAGAGAAQSGTSGFSQPRPRRLQPRHSVRSDPLPGETAVNTVALNTWISMVPPGEEYRMRSGLRKYIYEHAILTIRHLFQP